MTTLILRLLGPFEVATPQGALPIRRRQPLALLAYLALAHAPVSRDQLALLLCSDRGDAVARGRVRRILHEVRHTMRAAGLAADLLQVNGDAIALDHRRCDSDVARFVQAARGTAPPDPAVLALYRGPLLDGFRLNDAADFEAWLERERARFAVLRLQMLGRLAAAAAQRDDWSAVAAYAEMLVSADPLDEDAHVRLMQAYAAHGQHSMMLRQYDLLCDVLRRELDVEPLPETQARYQALLHGRTAPAPVAQPRADTLLAAPPFVGRQREVAAITAAAAAARANGFQIVCVQGSSGMGKTCLLDHALAGLRQADERRAPVVLRATCHAAPPPGPYQALVEAFQHVLPEASSVLHPPSGASVTVGTATEQRFWETLVRALRQLVDTDATLLVLVVDDLHWADPALLRALPYLIRRLASLSPQSLRCLVLLTCRTDDQPEAVTALLHLLARQTATTTWLDLAPLGATETLVLVRAALAREHGGEAWSALLLRETEGNPFVLVEMLRDLRARDQLNQPAPPDTPLPVPRRVRALIEERVQRLPAQAQQVAEAAAVIGRAVDVELVLRATSLRKDALVNALGRLEHAGILAADDHRYRFTHGTMQTVLYERLSLARRRLLHRAVARALAPGTTQATALLHHAQQAHEWALAYAAARQVAASARRVAARADALRFERDALAALHMLADYPERRFAVLLQCEEDEHLLGQRAAQAATLDALVEVAHTAEQHAQVVFRRGRAANALSHWDDARLLLERALAETTDPDVRCATQLALATCVEQQGQPEQALALAQQALADAHGPDGRPRRLAIFVRLAQLAQLREHYDQARTYLAEARLLAHGQPDVQAELWFIAARNRVRSGDYAAMLQEAVQGYNAAVAAGNLKLQADCLNLHGVAAGRLHRFSAAISAYEQAQPLYSVLENPQGEAGTLVNRAVLGYRLGAFATALAAAQAAFAIFTRIHDQRGCCIAAINSALVHVALGNGIAAEQQARTACAVADKLDIPMYRAAARASLAGALLQQQHFAAAHAMHKQALTLHAADSPERAPLLAWLALACLEQGDGAAAQQHSAEAVTLCERQPDVDFPQLIFAVRALVLHRCGDAPGAAAALAHAKRYMDEIAAGIPAPADRRSYLRNIPTNRFIRAARRGNWTAAHPLF